MERINKFGSMIEAIVGQIDDLKKITTTTDPTPGIEKLDGSITDLSSRIDKLSKFVGTTTPVNMTELRDAIGKLADTEFKTKMNTALPPDDMPPMGGKTRKRRKRNRKNSSS